MSGVCAGRKGGSLIISLLGHTSTPFPNVRPRRKILRSSALGRHPRCGPLSGRTFALNPGSFSHHIAAAATEGKTVEIFQRSYPLPGGSSLHVKVSESIDGTQLATVTTDAPGRLVLHWGVEGGRGYKGGWRLPGPPSRPDGTVEYKKRALQTPFNGGPDVQDVQLCLSGDEASDALVFVLKDVSMDRWYDLNGTNYKIPLRRGAAGGDVDHVEGSNGGSSSVENPVRNYKGATATRSSQRSLLPIDQVPPIPQDLSGVWSYMKWEAAGCPARSKEEADAEYAASVLELSTLLRRGIHLDELREVAQAGVHRYISFMAEHQQAWETPQETGKEEAKKGAATAAAVIERPPKEKVEALPDDMISLKAYRMWEDAGRPEGAEFGSEAREALNAEVAGGKSLDEVWAMLRAPPPAPVVESPAEQHADVKAPPKSAPEDPGYVGRSIGLRERNPLDLINRSSAPRLAEPQRVKETPLAPLILEARENEACVWHRVFPLGSKAEVLVAVKQADPLDPDSAVSVVMTTDAAADVVLHWGVKKAGGKRDWQRPSKDLLPPETELLEDGIAAETPFKGCDEEECRVEVGGTVVPLQRVEVALPRGHGLSALTFVIRSQDGSRWWKDGGSNFMAPVPGSRSQELSKEPGIAFDDELSRIIVDSEVKSGAWTLMHRFNKAAELIQGIINGNFGPPEEAMARVFVWLRYSSIRQLTWQRNYNTQPRILGAAQERLTHVIVDAYDALQGPGQEWARLCLTTVGRGGNAQAVRDEILNIMHRNKIPELKGTWMEEFHQKLHNNTTPDDIPICEAYLAFLRADGDLGAYWGALSDAGISRGRLESFDRPIVTEPTFFPDKKDALIKDFSSYLNILKATHSGADLQASASSAAPFVPSVAKGYLGYVLSHSSDPAVLPLIEAAVEARTELASKLTSNRELLYLDLALENVIRAAAERGAAASGTGAAALLAPLLQNLALSVGDNEEVCYCLKAWQELPVGVRTGRPPQRDDALRAMAVIDRVRRALSDISDRVFVAVGPVSAEYGEAFGCEPWAVQLFADEVVRGGPAFAVSLVLSSIEPSMRARADLGAWQVISPEPALGRIVVVPSLYEVQDKAYDEPTILVARRITGEEEVPVGAVGVLSGDAPDVLSHLSVRARNLRVLFAACHDPAVLDEVARLEGGVVALETTAAGAVTWRTLSDEESTSAMSSSENTASSESDGLFGDMPWHQRRHHKKLVMTVPAWAGKWALPMDGFKEGVVGAKSKNLAGLRGRLPDWIRLPASVTVPFGAFEETLKRSENQGLSKQLADAIKLVSAKNPAETLSECRRLAAGVVVCQETQAALHSAMQEAGIAPPAMGTPGWSAGMDALRAVWASKYNDRAYISTRKVGIPFDSVRMAVLTQRVVPARYAFVIHTRNPMTGDDDEIYCELVRGLGEAIVSGTVPGTALAFTAKKGALDDPKVIMYPSKSEGMFVEDGSLIFRSDSNGEDLEGYAGAGLYDSVTTATTVRRVVDYSTDSVVVDAEFQRKLLSQICRVGAEIESALGSPQDIEGVVDPELDITVVQTRPQM